MRVGLFCAVAVSVLLASAPLFPDEYAVDIVDTADGVARSLRTHHETIDISGIAPFAVDEDDPNLPISSGELAWLLERYREKRQGDGRGADITFGSLAITQTGYVNSNCPFLCPGGEACNVVLLVWTENTANPTGVDVYVDGDFLVNEPGLEQPGTNNVFVGLENIPAGLHTFRVEEKNEGTFDEVEIEILDAQPFGDVANIRCQQGALEEGGTCQLQICWSTGGPQADNLLLLNGQAGIVAIPRVAPFALRFIQPLTGATPGSYNFGVVGFLDDPENSSVQYRGCIVRAEECTVTCEDPGCRSPSCLWIAQTEYGPTNADVVLLALWENGVPEYPGGVELLAGGQVFATLPGDAGGAGINGPPGRLNLGVRGNCGGALSDDVELAFDVLAESPVSPVDGPITLSFDADQQSTTATWTNAGRSAFVFVSRVPDPAQPPVGAIDDVIEGFLAGTESTFTLAGTDPSDLLEFQFFDYVGDQAYGSERILGQFPAEDFFVRSLCSGSQDNATPQLNDAVLLFNFLFQSGEEPPCQVACDADSSGVVNLTDGIFVLNFLFQSGELPMGWPDANTPVCEPLAEGTPGFDLGCTTPRATCDGVGPAN